MVNDSIISHSSSSTQTANLEYSVGGIVLETAHPRLPNTSELMMLGKRCIDWVKLALVGATVTSITFRQEIELPSLIRPFVSPCTEFTVVLYSDTPLITKKTVFDAITTLIENRLNVLRMTRGWVFRTDFILAAPKIYSDRTYFFEEEDFVTVFDYKQAAMARELLRNRILSFHLENGVDIADLQSTFIESDVTIGKGVTIAAGNHLRGKTIIRDNVVLGTNNNICDSIIDTSATIESSIIDRSMIGCGTRVGPYSYIRPGSVIGNNCRIGDFVEVKNSKISDGSKLAHLTYAGDCEIGKNCNIGCGVVFANYDGEKKYKSVVGDNVFIGSNVNIIAPLTISDNAFIAAGSTLTDNVPASALAIARSRQTNKLDWRK